MSLESIVNNQEVLEEIIDTLPQNPLLENADINVENLKNYLIEVKEEGLDTANSKLSLEEVTIFEAIIEEEGRPAILIQNNTFQEPRLRFWKDRLEPHRTVIERFIPSVGRIEVQDHPRGFNYVGTGWLVTNDIIVTNRHVAETFAFKENGKFKFQKNPFSNQTIDVEIDFRQEFRIDEEEELEVTDVLYIEEPSGLDMAFLKIRSDRTISRSPIALSTSLPDSDSEIVVIGYPAEDSLRNPLEPRKLKEIFADIYDVKRLQPGFIDSVPAGNPVFTHDSSTLGGNSGSVVLDYQTGRAVGLHFGGRYKIENYAVPATIIEQRLNDLLSGRLTTVIAETQVIVFPTAIDLESVDNETPIELEDTPCLSPLEDDGQIEEVPFPAVNKQLPISGTGYYSYARFREKQFGLEATIKAIEGISEAWFQNHRIGPLIGVGNISKNGGGPVPPHSSHQTGLDVDFRLLRADGARIGVTFRDPNYSLARTQDLVNTILTKSSLSVKLILCNDARLQGVQPWPGHDDHLHVRFKR